MIDHVSIAVRDLAASAAHYARVLAPLGLTPLVERPGTVGFGKRYPEFWLNARPALAPGPRDRSEEHTSELQSRFDLVCRLLLEKKKKKERNDIEIKKKNKEVKESE